MSQEKVTFTYKPRLGPFAAAMACLFFLALSLVTVNLGLSETRISLYGLKLGSAPTKLMFFSFAALFAYVAIKVMMVTVRSLSGPRFVVLSPEGITSPLSPESKQSVTVKFSQIKSAEAVVDGKVSFLEINHRTGRLRIPNVMIESQESFEDLIQLVQERTAKAARDAKPSSQPVPPARLPAETVAETKAPMGPATGALLRAIDEKRKTDPLAGAKIGGKEVFDRLMRGMKNDRGVHFDSLLCALGSLAGYSCQASLRAQAVAKGMSETAAFMTVDGANGQKYFYGDPLNAPLAESKYSVWSLAAGAAQHNGCSNLPDIGSIFTHVTNTVGTDDFGIPRFPEGHNAGDLPINYLKVLWPKLLPTVKLFCKEPEEWPFLFGVAIQEALDAGKQVLSSEIALQIVMEAAIPMSKVDLAMA